MFLKSIIESFEIFLHWEFYLCIHLFIMLNSISELIYKDDETSFSEKKFKFFRVPAAILIQVISCYLFILTLAPIILKISSEANWISPISLIISNPKFVFLSVGIFLLLEIVVLMFPFFGGHRSVHLFVIGIITLIYYLGNLKKSGYNINGNIDLWPSGIEFLGFVVICILIPWVTTFIGLLYFDRLSQNQLKSKLYSLPMIAFVAIMGFFPVFVYGSWVGLQL